MKGFSNAIVPAILFAGWPAHAQQVKFIDLTAIEQRVKLRYPPAVVKEGGTGGGSVGASIGECAADARDPRSLAVLIDNALESPTDPREPFLIEFRVMNTGSVPLSVPVSPHLSDLQPQDASAPFNYLSIALVVSPAENRGSIGSIELYGRDDVPGTILILNPGEWLRVEARVRFLAVLPPLGTVNLVPGFWMRRVTVHPHPGGMSEELGGICVRSPPATSVLVYRH